MSKRLRIGTTRRGLPLAMFELQTPSGARTWRYVWDRGQARLLRDSNPERPIPRWVAPVIATWSRCLLVIQSRYGMWLDETKRTRPLLELVVKLAHQALLYQTPAARKIVQDMATKLHRMAADRQGPEDVRGLYLETSSRLSDSLRRTAPPKRAGDEGPTEETLAHVQAREHAHEASYVDGLKGHELEAANEIREIYHAITSKVDAHAGNLTGGGGGNREFLQPFETLGRLGPAYEQRYRPWSLQQARQRAVPHLSATRLQVIHAVLIEDLSLGEADERYRLPGGRARSILEEGLTTYPTIRR